LRKLLEDMIERFNRKVEGDGGLREELQGLEKTIQIASGPHRYYMTLRDCRIEGLVEGEHGAPDLAISADEETLKGVLEGEIPPFKAIATGKLRIKATIEDVIRLRKLLS
jgi:putative sterol carrier protein